MSSQFHGVCHSKPHRTQAEARQRARELSAQFNRWHTEYPCPYTKRGHEVHWHEGRVGKRQLDIGWYREVDARAKERGCVGWPEGYVDRFLRYWRKKLKKQPARELELCGT